MTSGIWLMHKPVGPTSFSLVKECLARSDGKKVCHGGALDPFASGLMLMLVEPATKLFDYLHAIPKVYEATVRWGVETDNCDLNGRAISTGDASGLTPAQLDETLATFVGWRDQIPPATSNKRIDGERAYLKAHRGEAVVLPASKVYLHEARWLSHELPHESRLRLTVRGGYYVRALARDLGRAVGCGAHLTQLHRSSIGPWTDPGLDNAIELHGRDVLPWASTRVLSDQEIGDIRNSGTIPKGQLQPPDWKTPDGFPDPPEIVRGFHLDRFCFLLKCEGDCLQVAAALRGGL